MMTAKPDREFNDVESPRKEWVETRYKELLQWILGKSPEEQLDAALARVALAESLLHERDDLSFKDNSLTRYDPYTRTVVTINLTRLVNRETNPISVRTQPMMDFSVINTAGKQILRQLFLQGQTDDSQLVNPEHLTAGELMLQRDKLIEFKLVERWNRWNFLTLAGVKLVSTVDVRQDRVWFGKQFPDLIR